MIHNNTNTQSKQNMMLTVNYEHEINNEYNLRANTKNIYQIAIEQNNNIQIIKSK